MDLPELKFICGYVRWVDHLIHVHRRSPRLAPQPAYDFAGKATRLPQAKTAPLFRLQCGKILQPMPQVAREAPEECRSPPGNSFIPGIGWGTIQQSHQTNSLALDPE